MSERITRQNLDARVENLNRRMESRGSIYRYQIQARNGYIGLDRVYAADGKAQNYVRVGTKGQIGEFLHAMMVALDDAATVA